MRPHPDPDSETWLRNVEADMRRDELDPIPRDALYEYGRELGWGSHADDDNNQVVQLALGVPDTPEGLPAGDIAEITALLQYSVDLVLWANEPRMFTADLPAPTRLRPRWTPRVYPAFELPTRRLHYGTDIVYAVWLSAFFAPTAIPILKYGPAWLQVHFARAPRAVRKAENQQRIAEAQLATTIANLERQRLERQAAQEEREADAMGEAAPTPPTLGGDYDPDLHNRVDMAREAMLTVRQRIQWSLTRKQRSVDE